jgi:hypothetical protein
VWKLLKSYQKKVFTAGLYDKTLTLTEKVDDKGALYICVRKTVNQEVKQDGTG